MAKGDILRRREIERLSASLPSLTSAQEWEAQLCCGTAWLGSKKGWCDACGREFDHDLWNSRKKHMVCPKCGARLEVRKSPNKRKEHTRYYYHVITTAGDWQVVRTFHCDRTSTRVERFGTEILNPSEVKMSICEVFQKFIKPQTVPIIIGLGFRGMSYYSDVWKWDSPWEIRKFQNGYGVWGWVSKEQELLPELRMKGLKRLSEGCSPSSQIEKVFNDWQAEVLLKNKATKLFDKYVREPYKMQQVWPSVRIALRHKYRITDVQMWLDHLDLLRRNGKDLRNPKYICPSNLRELHNEQLAIQERIRAKREQERKEAEARRVADMLSEDGKTNQEFLERMGKMLGVVVVSGDVVLKPLQNIRDFFEEGSELHHCVFQNKYYQHKNCLIIGARVKGKRTETIEIDTKEWKVMQCRGPHNQPTKHHDKILTLMRKNMDKFRRMAI